MDRKKRRKQWQWVIGLMIGAMCGLVAAPRAEAITSCGSLPEITKVGFTTDTVIQHTFLDNKTVSPTSWTLIARARNPSASSQSYSYQLTVTVAGKTCTAGPAFLTPGTTGTKNCTITPEYTATGLYTLNVNASGNSSLQWQYIICQN